MKPAVVRFYFDADVLGVGKLLASINPEITYPGAREELVHKRLRSACSIPPPPVPDEVWIPEVARLGWLAITRDRHIKSRPSEIAAVRDHGARLVALAGNDAINTWAQLEVLMTKWRDIAALHDLPGPFIYTATRTGTLKKVL